MKHTITEKLVVWAIALVAVMAVAVAFWALWTWIMPIVWPTGPAQFINPGFWLFIGACALFKFVVGFFK